MRGLSDLEPDRLARLALNHRGTLLDAPGCEDIPDPEGYEIAPAQLAVDGHVEQRKVTGVARHLEPDPDRPDMPRQEWALLPDDAALVPGDAGGTESAEKIDGHENTSCPPGPPFFGHADQGSIPQ